MKDITLQEIMDRNVQMVQIRASLSLAQELIQTGHLIIVQGERPVGVLTEDDAGLLQAVNFNTLLNVDWVPPLIAMADTKVLELCREHRDAMRPVVVIGPLGQVEGLVTVNVLLQTLSRSIDVLNTFFTTLIDTVNEAITVVTQDGRVSHWNAAAQEMYSIPSQAIAGKNIAGFFEKEDLATLKMLDQGRPIRQAYHRPRPGTHVLINASPIIYEGKIVGAISSEQDITQIVRLNEELSHTSSQLRDLTQKINPSNDPFTRIIGRSSVVKQTVNLARKVADSEATVLITGESGVGKELFAQAIHQASARADKPFIALNCGAIPTPLFESELFGYHGGAFTGAERKGKPGKLELADGGTLLLDEVGELPPELQVKLLRVLQDKCFYRVGGTEPIKVNTRIIAATNRNLEKMIGTGQFREDLYYRLNVIAIEVPPLRERTEDIPELVQMFLQEFAAKYNKPVPALDPEIMVKFLTYPWPGNVRELRNVTERLAILSDEEFLTTQFLPPTLKSSGSNAENLTLHQGNLPALEIRNRAEVERIIQALHETYGNKSAAAKLLGISRGTLYYKLKQYGLG